MAPILISPYGSQCSNIVAHKEQEVFILPPKNKGFNIYFKLDKLWLFSSVPVHQWQILKLQFLWRSSHNQRLGRRNRPGPGSPKSGNWQRNCWRCRPCRSCWCSQGTRFRWGTFCGRPPETRDVPESAEAMRLIRNQMNVLGFKCYNLWHLALMVHFLYIVSALRNHLLTLILLASHKCYVWTAKS